MVLTILFEPTQCVLWFHESPAAISIGGQAKTSGVRAAVLDQWATTTPTAPPSTPPTTPLYTLLTPASGHLQRSRFKILG